MKQEGGLNYQQIQQTMTNRAITQLALDLDTKLRERMDYLEQEGHTNSVEYQELHHMYYVENYDIRMYWKTY